MSELITDIESLALMIAGYNIRKAFTVAETAKIFGRKVDWVYDQIKSGNLEVNELPKRRRSIAKQVTYITKRSIENFPN